MPSNEDRIVLGVDLDGVCADFYARMREVAAEWFERPIDDLTTSPTYGLREWGVEANKYDNLHRFAVTSRELFASVPMIPGARKVLRRLSDEDYHIRIITHRLFIHFSHAVAVQQTIEWLDQHAIPYRDLCFMKDKDQVGADIYIEDAPHNVERLRKKYYTICFANSTNTMISEPRAKDWEEVYDLVKKWSGPRE
jgi:5'(3')-deoxyribonucleotidase